MLLRVVVWGDGCCLGVVVWGDNRYLCFLCTYLVEFPSPFLSSSTTKGWKCAGLRGNNRYINTFLPYVSNANSWRDGRISYKETKLTLSCTMETRLTKEQKTRAPIHLSKKQNHWILSVFCLIDERFANSLFFNIKNKERIGSQWQQNNPNIKVEILKSTVFIILLIFSQKA